MKAGPAVRKRLQGARKFWLLVQQYGTAVLNEASQVSVSKVDLLGLEDHLKHQQEDLTVL